METALRVLLSSILLTVGITVTATGVIDTESAAKFFNEVFGRKEQVIIEKNRSGSIIII